MLAALKLLLFTFLQFYVFNVSPIPPSAKLLFLQAEKKSTCADAESGNEPFVTLQSTPLYSDTLVYPDFARIKRRNGLVRFIREYSSSYFVLFLVFLSQ